MSPTKFKSRTLTESMKRFANFKIQEWATALRSGKYFQGTEDLRTAQSGDVDRFCCLGVLGDLSSSSLCMWGTISNFNFFYLYDSIYGHLNIDWTSSGQTATVPDTVWENLFFPRYLCEVENPEFAKAISHVFGNISPKHPIQYILYELNDSYMWTFDEIAALVELLKYNI